MRFTPAMQDWFNVRKSMPPAISTDQRKISIYQLTYKKYLIKSNIHSWLKIQKTSNKELSQLGKEHLTKAFSSWDHTSWWKMECLSSQVGNKARMFSLSFAVQNSSAKRYPDQKGGAKQSQFTDYITVYPKKSRKKLLELRSST